MIDEEGNPDVRLDVASAVCVSFSTWRGGEIDVCFVPKLAHTNKFGRNSTPYSRVTYVHALSAENRLGKERCTRYGYMNKI